MKRPIAMLAVCLLVATATAQPPAIQIATVTGGVSEPILVTHAGDCSGRIFIVQQSGIVRIHDGSTLLGTPFINIGPTGLGLISTGSERGLLGMAFHPDYENNGFFYLSYTRSGNGASIVSRWSVSPNDPNVALTTESIIIGPVAQPESNHNGGGIAFGPDGMLYFGLGDGGGAGDAHGSIGNGQDTGTLLGKMLRVDVDGGTPYAIPPDNPFVGVGNPLDEIYAYGLRNPWRWSFDRRDGRLFLGDVGQGTREEIDIITSGGNYGWRRMEGTFCFNPSSGCQTGSLLLPIFDYSSAGGAQECSVTGGYMYRGNASPALDGTYIYGDYCSGRIWGLQETGPGTWTNTQMLDLTFNVSSFGEDEFGEVYICNHSGAAISRIVGPTGVIRVTSPTPDGAYSAGAVIQISILFNRIVVVAGAPTLMLDTGTPGAQATFVSGSDTNTLQFNYTVQETDDATDLDYLDTASLLLNGGSILDGSLVAASISLPSIGDPGSISCGKQISFDNVDPVLLEVFAGTADGTYGIGATIPVVVRFDEDVTVTGAPTIALDLSGTPRAVPYSNGSGSFQIQFDYVVAEGDVTSLLDYVDSNALSLNGGGISDFALNAAAIGLPAPGDPGSLGDNSAIAIDGIRPRVVDVTTTLGDGAYGVGQSIDIFVEFDEAPTVVGTPTLTLETGAIDAIATFQGMQDAFTMRFVYVVAAGESAADLDYASTTALSPAGGTIRDAALNDGNLTLPAPGAGGSLGENSSLVIDGVPPRVDIVSTNLPDGTYGVGQVIDIFVEFDEAITVVGTPTLTLETGDVDGIASFQEMSGPTTMRFQYTVVQGDQSGDLDYVSTTALALAGGTIRDGLANDATLTLASPGEAGSLGGGAAIVIVTPPLIRASGAVSY